MARMNEGKLKIFPSQTHSNFTHCVKTT